MAFKLKKTDCEFLENVFPNVWAMTSREFHTDPHARADLIAAQLKDKVTMKIFEEAIRFNRHLFKGKVVLVLNAGIDLCFPLWASKYGAEHVYAVDNSQAVDYIAAIVEPNNMNGKITVLKGRVQEIELPVSKVDLILSNWMGYALLIEDKISSVIYARDKWLKPNGVIFPDNADLLIAGVQNSKSKNKRIDWWSDVQNFNMNAIRKTAATEPTFQKIDPSEILTMPVKVWSINLRKITQIELRFKTPFYIEITQGGCLEGLLAYFDVRFLSSHVPVQFSTSPWAPYTKWLQTVFYFDDPISVNVGERYHGGIRMNHCFKDGCFATNTYLELYSGMRVNLSLLFNRNWLCKWVYTDHTNGAEKNKCALKKNQQCSNEKSAMDAKLSTPKSRDGKKTLKTAVKALDSAMFNALSKETKHDWSFETMQKELQSTLLPNPKPNKSNKQKGKLFETTIGAIKGIEYPKLPESNAAMNTNAQKIHSSPLTNGFNKQKPKYGEFNGTMFDQKSSTSSLLVAKKSKHSVDTCQTISNRNLPPKDFQKPKPNQTFKTTNNIDKPSDNVDIDEKTAGSKNQRKNQKPKQKRKYAKKITY